jgi:hypothetical protein
MYQHVTGEKYVAFENTAVGDSGSGNQVSAAVGIRTRL